MMMSFSRPCRRTHGTHTRTHLRVSTPHGAWTTRHATTHLETVYSVHFDPPGEVSQRRRKRVLQLLVEQKKLAPVRGDDANRAGELQRGRKARV